MYLFTYSCELTKLANKPKSGATTSWSMQHLKQDAIVRHCGVTVRTIRRPLVELFALHCHVMTPAKTFTHTCLYHQAVRMIPTKRKWYSVAAKVNLHLAWSNHSLPASLWLKSPAENLDQLWHPSRCSPVFWYKLWYQSIGLTSPLLSPLLKIN